MPGLKRKHNGEVTANGDISLPKTKRSKPTRDETIEDASSEADQHKKLGKLSSFPISKATRKMLKSRGVKFLFPIQYKTFDHVYEGKDVIGQARTGTGKTLSFVLPIVERLSAEGSERKTRGRPPIVLVMAPTRELANQVHAEFKALAPEGLRSYCIYGGTPYDPQQSAIRNGIDILVGTPGRIWDLMRRGTLNLGQLKHVILDEADQMLERGFADTVEEILAASFKEATPDQKPQTLLFSATVPLWVQETAERYMTADRVLVDLIGQQTIRTAVTVDHKAICCPYTERPSTIADVVQVYSGAHGRAIIFTQTKQDANELALNDALKQDCQVLHGDIPQKQREITLKGFRQAKFQVLVATDVAARGLDIPEVDLVIQCEPPKDVEAYIHRSGRTGRAGRTGVCILFYKPQQEYLIAVVEGKAGIQFQRIGAPQTADIIKAAARDSMRSLEEIPDSVLPHFKDAAAQLIEERGAETAVAAALAYISGSKEIVSRSLLSAQQGYTTYHLTTEQEIRSPGYFWKILERCFPVELKDAVKGLRMCKDSKGVVFDLPNSFVSVVEEDWEDGYAKLCVPSTLPELKDRPTDYFDRSRGNRGGGSGYFNGFRGRTGSGRNSFSGQSNGGGGRTGWRRNTGGFTSSFSGQRRFNK